MYFFCLILNLAEFALKHLNKQNLKAFNLDRISLFHWKDNMEMKRVFFIFSTCKNINSR